MSIKTLRKRIALVAVSALGVGLLSVAPASAAPGDVTLGTGSSGVLVAFAETSAGVSATATINSAGALAIDVAAQTGTGGDDFTFASITGGTFTALASGGAIATGGASATSTDAAILNDLVATPTAAFTDMVIKVYLGSDATGTLQYTVTVSVRPVNGVYAFTATGLCTAYDASTGVAESLADDSGTIELALGGTLQVDSTTADLGVSVGANLIIISSEGGNTPAVDANGLGVSSDLDLNENVVIKAASVGTSKVSVFVAASPATITDYFYIKVVASCGASTYSAAYSSYETSSADQFDKSLVPTDGGADSSPDGETGSFYSFHDTDEAVISILAKNQYNANLPLGTFIVSATNGALVSIGTSSAAPGATSVASAAVSAGNIYAQVGQPTDGVPLVTTVTITYNSTKIYEKTLTFLGDLASLTVSGVDVQAVGGNSIKSVYDVVAKDSAGNLLIWSVGGESAKYNQMVSAVTGGYTTMTGTGRLDGTNDNTDDATIGSWTCGAKSGSTPMRLAATTNAGTTVYSNEFAAACGSAAFTYTASLDKAKYVPGDIATLTVTAKDASGFAPFKAETVNADPAVAPAIAGSQMTAINTPATSDVFDAAGKKTYTFTVGSTAGKYNMAVNLGYSGNAAVSVAYEVGSDGSVSNAEVLAAIVKLIASINKQIKALQKSLKR